jgi:hypothetical protein
MKIHLVDGTYELFRSYFGAPPKKAPDGREVGATLGLLNSLLALLTKSGATHVACAFDHVVESFRNDLFPGYKTSAGVPHDLLAQFALAEQAVAAFGVVVWPMVEFEADDALASAARRFRSADGVDQVVIMREPTPAQAIGLTDQQTLHDTMIVGQQYIPLTANGYRCQTADLWRLLLSAAARRTTIEATCADLTGAPDANIVRGFLTE